MNGKIALGVISGLALLATPAVAQSVLAPTVAPMTGEETSLGGEGILIGVIATAAVVGGIVVLSEDNDNQVPVSG